MAIQIIIRTQSEKQKKKNMVTEYVYECCIVEGIDFSLSLSVIFGLLFIDGLLIIQFVSPHQRYIRLK